MSGDWRADVLKFWFALTPEQWWNGNPELDHRIRENFLKLWVEKRQLPALTRALVAPPGDPF